MNNLLNCENSQPQLASNSHGYPRPQLVRPNWTCLNGTWEFAIDVNGVWTSPARVDWSKTIIVPFAPETTASGIDDRGFYKVVWYRRRIQTDRQADDDRLILHFGAVDWSARVFINNQFAGEHHGGYTPFEIDVTDLVGAAGEFEVVVRAEDNPHDLEKNRGKQDWELKEHSIWYPRTTGIWQTVWMETVPACYIAGLVWTARLNELTVSVSVSLSGETFRAGRLAVELSAELLPAQEVVFTISSAERELGLVERTIALDAVQARLLLPDEYINEVRRRLFWHPDHPNLIEAKVRLLQEDFSELDSVGSYTALRSVQCRGNQFFVNENREQLRLVLDQGYWSESGMTPVNDDAIADDIRLVKEAGFNGVRKHNKLEDPRFLYWADRLGLYVWEELPSAYLFTPRAASRSIQTWTEAIARDRNHPCIIAWVPVNESWGLPQLPVSDAQRRFQRSLYELTKSLTDSIVIGNDGWEMAASDILAIHDYDADLQRFEERYRSDPQSVERLFRHERPGGRVLLLDDMSYQNKPIMITEFGGIKLSRARGSWGYSDAVDAVDLCGKFSALMRVVHRIGLLSGFCYTEFTDVYQEANGLFHMDRSPKFAIEEIRSAVLGR